MSDRTHRHMTQERDGYRLDHDGDVYYVWPEGGGAYRTMSMVYTSISHLTGTPWQSNGYGETLAEAMDAAGFPREIQRAFKRDLSG